MQQRRKQQNNTSYQLALYTQTHTTNWDYDNSFSFLTHERTTTIPVSIFSGEHAPLQALVTYLRDELKYSFKELTQLLGRAESTLRVTYRAAKECGMLNTSSNLTLPLGLFDSHLSILEVTVSYLHKEGLRNVDIAAVLNKDPRTTSTVLRRAKEKGVMHDA